MEHHYTTVENPICIFDQTDDLYARYKYALMIDPRKEHGKARKNLEELLNMIRGLESEIISKRPYLSEIYRLFADNCMSEGAVGKAGMLCEEGLQLFPESDELRLYYGHSLTRLHRFEGAEDVLNQMDNTRASHPKHPVHPGLYTFRKYSTLGELYQRWGNYEKARENFKTALSFRDDWFPAHVGLVELEIIQQDIVRAGQYLKKVTAKLGPQPVLILTAAHLALISKKFEKADDLAAKLEGRLLEDERFEYLLFLIDFFRKDRESFLHVPYMLKGESVETEAARVWLLHLKGKDYNEDLSRIPEDVWREEYNELDAAWQGITKNQ